MINPKIAQIWRDYDIIIVIMGKNYREVLSPFFDNKFYVVFDRRGIGGYKSLIANYLKLTTPLLLRELKKFQSFECGEYLWNVWNFASPRSYIDPNRPHCCKFCCYHESNKCKFSELFPQHSNKLLEDNQFIKRLSTKEESSKKVKISSKLYSYQ